MEDVFVRNPYERSSPCCKNRVEDVTNFGDKNIFEKHGIGHAMSFDVYEHGNAEGLFSKTGPCRSQNS